MGLKRNGILYLLIIMVICLDFVPLYEQYESMAIYVIKPFVWLCLLIFTRMIYKDEYIMNSKYKKDITIYVFIATIVYFSMYFFVGYIENFAHNPYNRSLGGLILNLWTFGTVIVSKEYLRYYLINNCDKKNIYLNGIIISIIFAFSEINKLNFLSNFESFNNIIKFLIESISAEMFISLFLTYVAYYASYKATLIYRLIPLVLTLTLRILPNINWMLHSLIKATVPFFAYIYMNSSILKIDNKSEKKEYEKGFKFWRISSAILILVVAFGIRLLPYYPIVIATGSMEPGINVGDIVIVKKQGFDLIKENDVVEYSLGNYKVIHRVVEKRENALVTKGDNNYSIDPLLVKEKQVNGVIKARIPYLGYPTIFINKLFGNDLEDEVSVETGRE